MLQINVDQKGLSEKNCVGRHSKYDNFFFCRVCMGEKDVPNQVYFEHIQFVRKIDFFLKMLNFKFQILFSFVLQNRDTKNENCTGIFA